MRYRLRTLLTIKWFRFSIKDILWLTILVAVIVAWRVDVHKVTRLKDESIDFWYGSVGRAHKTGSEQGERLSFHYRTQLNSMRAEIDKLVEENHAMRKALEENAGQKKAIYGPHETPATTNDPRVHPSEPSVTGKDI